ncbi:MAG: tRNA (N(6)-L-threonylcarbamoyladenosine(37)-C(2))-methylthiotransferase MtaB [Clostridia bacterium]|nr:tRNA (N(6)-L-threonylcarbamoyladenosine(37)-C(2))-methylthiotransferase MtaB [Clostridia bacterium]
MKKKIAVHTLGCKVNQYDTEAMLESFERAGWEAVPFDSGEADLYLVNTCTVTGTGDQKSVRLIRHLGREYPGADIIVSGCLAQRDAARVALPGVRLIIGTQRRGEVVALYEQALLQSGPLAAVEPLKGASFEELFVTRHEGKTRAVMKIQEGCDRWCSYCIIPSVRGPVRSMPLAGVKAEAERLAAAGYRELVLTGIHLASYGRESGESLIDAIRAAHDAPGVQRVRLGSLEPLVVTEAFCRALEELPRLCPQFHLALQSGSDSVLSRMKRRYTTAEFREAAQKLRAARPGCALTTDVLTGFPGETEAEAAETLAFVEAMGFARIHVFPYSRRAGTLADRMGAQVPQAVKRERCAKLIELGNKLEASYAKEMIGTVREVLFEEDGEGYTPEYVRVRADEAGEPGEIRRVLIERTEDALALGRVLHHERSE